MIQLSLFPERGYGLLLPGSRLAYDPVSSRPAIYSNRARARYALKHHFVGWIREQTEIVSVLIHDDCTYVVAGKPAKVQATFRRRRFR